jgi:hypothetical protein
MLGADATVVIQPAPVNSGVSFLRTDLKPPLRIPATYWVGEDIRELENISDQLPSRWVLKPNHSAGRYALIDSSASPVDWVRLRTLGDSWVRRDEEELVLGHWAYGRARHLLIAEERVGNGVSEPNDFKVSCFDGAPRYFFWADRSQLVARYAFFHPDGRSFSWGDAREVQANATSGVVLPTEVLRQRMLRIAAAATEPFDWMRVDFYVEGNEVWFGELTLYGAGGLYVIDDVNNERLGALWQLPDLSAPDPREAEWRALLERIPRGTLQE